MSAARGRVALIPKEQTLDHHGIRPRRIPRDDSKRDHGYG